MRALGVLIIMFWGIAAQAQSPRVTVDLSAPTTLVGQPLDLVVTVLVPTWMIKPPVFPNFEVPSLLVRLPEKSTLPISERVGGETWSGVRRRYKLYPLTTGRIELPSQDVIVTYADPDTRAPITGTLRAPDVVFEARVPIAARELDPVILAQDFVLEQEIEGIDPLEVGDAIVRTVRAAIDGTTVVLIPALVPDVDAPGLRAYPAEPVITEQESRGAISGTRTEKVTYVAQSGGTNTLPPIQIAWYNIATGAVETARLPGIPVTVEAESETAGNQVSRETLVRLAAGLLILVICIAVIRRYQPQISAWASSVQARWTASELYARRAVKRAIRARDLGSAYTALEIWVTRVPVSEADLRPLKSALTEVGQATFEDHAARVSSQSAWQKVAHAFAQTVAQAKRQRKARDEIGLPPLNPF